jgi:uncharacterized protein YndB with AHSA1/START domain
LKGGGEKMRVEASVVVNRPIEEVFAFVSDLTNTPQWATEILEMKKTSEGPVGVGTTFTSAAKMLGQQLENAHEILEYEPSRKLVLNTTAGPISVDAEVFTFEPEAGGTRITHVIEGDPGGFFKLTGPIVARLMQRQWDTNFDVLKELLEAPAEGSA